MSAPALWLGVALLGGLGALLRVAVTARVDGAWRGTLLVNLVGATALGVLLGLDVSRELTLLVGGGLLGALTTFSTWIAEGVDRRSPGLLVGALALGLAAAAVGHALGVAL